MRFVPPAAEKTATYSVGDYVWCIGIGGRGNLQLGRIANAQPKRVGRDVVHWMVNVRLPTGWTIAVLERRVREALSAAQVAHNRKLGLIPERAS